MYDQLMKVAKGFRLVHIGMLVIIIGAVGGLLGMCLGLGVLGAGRPRWGRTTTDGEGGDAEISSVSQPPTR